MTGKKLSVMGTAYYLITLEKELMEKSSPGCLGKLRSNMFGTEYNIFDKGENPISKCPVEFIRNQYGAVLYVYFIC